MASHSLLAPSAASRWMRCPASVALAQDNPDVSSVFAAEGSVAHLIATRLLTEDDYAVPVGDTIEYEGHKILVTRDMQDHVHDYVDLVREYAKGGSLLVEQKVDFSFYVNMEGQTGTSDAIIVKGRECIMIDLKYGMGVRVDAVENEQLMLYALGAYDVASLIDEIDQLVLVIHQPRLNHVSEFHLSAQQLLEFGKRAEQAAARVQTALEAHAEGQLVYRADSTLYAPGEKQCRFCPSKAVCPALREEVMLYTSGGISSPATVEEFAALAITEVSPDMSDNYLAVAMDKVGLIEDWCLAIRAEIERRLFAGQPVEGYKLVQGKQGNRKWIEPNDAEAVLKLTLTEDDMYDRSLISPTTAEKRLKRKYPDVWKGMQPLIHRAPGKASVAPATDPRPALAAPDIAAEFRAIAAVDNGE